MVYEEYKVGKPKMNFGKPKIYLLTKYVLKPILNLLLLNNLIKITIYHTNRKYNLM